LIFKLRFGNFFEERQCFAKGSTRNFFFVLALFFTVSVFVRWLIIKSIDDSLIAFFISGPLLTLIAALFLSNCLITQLRTDGIYIRFPLLDPSVKQFLWSDIQELYITDYNPMEYGGWGVRISPAGTAYNFSGRTGLHITLRDGNKVLIGTKNPEGITDALRKMGQL
jgi:hypothetical protein